MESLSDFASATDSFIWSLYPLIPVLIDIGIILTIRLGAIHLVKLGPALRPGLIDRNSEDAEEDITSYQAPATAPAATVGVGNIVGVATAIGLDGPGALSWMWVTGLLGMAPKYSEAFLGVKYRQVGVVDEQSDGPQYYLRKAISNGFGKMLGILLAVSATLVAFGIGNLIQGNAAVSNLENSFDTEPILFDMIMLVLVGVALMGGTKSVSRITAGFVPMMIVLHIGAAVWVLVVNASALSEIFKLIFIDAFTGIMVVDGFAGSTLILALQTGVACGPFSNESDLGSGAIAAAAASTTHSVRQGLVSMTQTFIGTIIVASFTGLVITSTGVWQDGSVDTGALTAEAFSRGLPGHQDGIIVTLPVAFFAFSTMLDWFYYDERAFEFLVGRRGTGLYRAVFTCVVFVGAVTHSETVQSVALALNGLMALPNLIGLVVLFGLIARETKAYLRFDPQLRATAAEIGKWQAQQDFEAFGKNQLQLVAARRGYGKITSRSVRSPAFRLPQARR